MFAAVVVSSLTSSDSPKDSGLSTHFVTTEGELKIFLNRKYLTAGQGLEHAKLCWNPVALSSCSAVLFVDVVSPDWILELITVPLTLTRIIRAPNEPDKVHLELVFPSPAEAMEACKMLDMRQIAMFPTKGIECISEMESCSFGWPATESWLQIPSCLICLRRIDSTTSGLDLTENSRAKQPLDPNCKACKILFTHKEDGINSKCSTCSGDKQNWVCLICGEVGCGRYRNGDAFNHYIATKHAFALEIETQRIWSYDSDSFCHTLNLNQVEGDFNLAELGSQQGFQALEKAFQEYCELVSEQLQSQATFYENIRKNQILPFEQQNDRLKSVLAGIEKQFNNQIELGKKTAKKIKKHNNELSDLQKQIMEETMILEQEERLIAAEYDYRNDPIAIRKQKELEELEKEMQDAFKQLTDFDSREG